MILTFLSLDLLVLRKNISGPYIGGCQIFPSICLLLRKQFPAAGRLQADEVRGNQVSPVVSASIRPPTLSKLQVAEAMLPSRFTITM